ncbi:TonB-dependent receptor domain-containing protein [Sphingomonas humi]|uniref:TonB-dependent receptor n=1 Tax=Sphingomonas humi TaxID=335630 RepID=A0ABP7SCJ2_9SPHN
MGKFSFLGTTALRGLSAATLLIGGASAAQAQQTAQDQQQETAPATPATPTSEQEAESGTQAQGTEVVVTGSRIRRPNLDSPVPVTSVGGQEFFETGNVSVGDTLNDLPALRSTFSQANSTRFLGTSGLNLLDLRGLGTVRTLVLVNGRRHVGGDVLNYGVTPDVNTIPTDLIDRVDVVTGGNSAVYGSDAIAGVVNFILKDNYEGLQLRGQSGISKYEDAGASFVSVLAGKNFADGRGNIAINAEYARQDQYFGSQRPWLRSQDGYVVVDTDPAGLTNGSDGVFDRVYFRDIRNSGLSNTGVIRFGGNATLNGGTDTSGAFFNVPFIFNRDGTLVPITGQRVGIGPNGSFIGGNGENFRGGNQFQLSPKLDRYNVNLIAHFEITPALVPFVEAKFSRTNTAGVGSSGPAFITGGTLGDSREQIRFDNPYLTAQARSVITAQRALAGLSAPTATTRLSVRENLEGLGGRYEIAKRDTYRIVGGLRGTFNDDWTYEISGNYGRLKETTSINGNLDIQRFLLANDAAINPATGTIQCRSQFSTAARIGYIDEGARLANDIAQCVPINVLGGNFTQAQRDYVLLDSVAVGKTEQIAGLAFVSGDTSQFLNLPGGPVGFVVGGEYREDNLFYNQDEEVQAGYTFYNAIPTFQAKKSKVKEAFAEIRIPLLKDVPFFNTLEISGAGRVSDYNLGNTGTVYAYNASAVWAPVRDLRIRGNYARSVRAPNQSELFSPLGQNFAPGFGDPCSARNIGTGSTNRAANCKAAGIPTTFDYAYPNGSLETLSGGNGDLAAEKADSYTVGFVATPRFIPGFSFSVDFYDITVNNVITTPSAQQIANACYDAANLQNQFCALFQRAGANGAASGEEPFQIIEGSLVQQPLNYAKLKARGLDFEIGYRRDLGFGRLDTRLTYTRVLKRSDFLNPAEPNREDVVRFELGDPRDAFNWNNSLKFGNITAGYQMRYIGKQVLNTYEDYFAVQGRPPENADFADRKFYPQRFYHDVRLGIDATSKFNFYLGVDNLANTKPPLGATGIGGGSAIWDNRGRFFYAGAVAKF